MALKAVLARFLRRHRLLAADSMVFIYHLDQHRRYAPATRAVLRGLEEGSHSGVTSVLTLAEVLLGPLRAANLVAVKDYRRILTTFPNLQLLDVNRAIAETAAGLRAAHGLDAPDAIQVATAMAAGATGLVSNDSAFKRVKGIEVLILDDVVAARD